LSTHTPNHAIHDSDDVTRGHVQERLDDNLYIEAGAGTGKTDALVRRLTALLASGTARPDQVAAITFTRAAAFEMRTRLRSALETQVTREPDETKRTALGAVVDQLDALTIQTIHAFALALLKERPLDIGLPPVIEPLDDIESAAQFDEQWDEWFRERIESDDDLIAALGIANRLGLTAPADRLKELANLLDERLDSLDVNAFRYHGPPPPGLPVKLLQDALSEVTGMVAGVPDQSDTLCRFVLEIFAPEVESLLALAGDATDVSAADLAGVPSLKPNGRQKGASSRWKDAPGGDASLEHLRSLLDELQAAVDSCLDVLKKSTAGILFTTAIDFASKYSQERRATGQLTFHDQLVLARDLLRSSDAARAHVQDRFRFVLVDEFQDTDPVQIELLKLLAGGANDGEFRNGNLFLVGDPKQSIYRFRGADPVSAKDFAVQVGESGAKLHLSENHRSLPGILQWVNVVFSRWMQDGKVDDQADYSELRWEEKLGGAESEIGGVPVQWFGGPVEVNADGARQLEFGRIATIAAAAGAGAFRVRERGSNDEVEWRDSKFDDVAILVKSRTGIEVLEDELVEKKVPYVLEGQAMLFSSQDVRDLHSCLTAIDDPANQVAVLAAVRSAAYSCPDNDLLDWKHAGGGFSYTDQLPTNGPASVGAAFDSLLRYHRLSREVQTSELVERFIRERRLREKAALARRGPERMRRLDLISELAYTLGDSDGVTLRDFTRWLKQQADDNARMPERISQGEVSGAVRVMTIHGSKGLEFPVVILPVASGGSRGMDSVKVKRWMADDGVEQIALQLGDKNTGLASEGMEQANEQDATGSKLENVRLMYVAATRARDHLFVSRFRGMRAREALIDNIESHLGGDEHLWREWVEPVGAVKQGSVTPPQVDTVARRTVWEQRRVDAIGAASRSRYTTPTALKPDKAQHEPLPKEPSEDLDTETTRRGRGATERGRAVHAVLQLVNLGEWTPADVSSLSHRMAHEHAVGGDDELVTALAMNALGTPVMQRAAAAAGKGEVWREVSVAAGLEGVDGELEGQIDLLFREPDKTLTVVDHKTDYLGVGKDLALAAEPYLLQMGAYAWAVERVTGQQVGKAVLVFARGASDDGASEYEVPDLASLKLRASQMAVERIVGSA
jgi:ATP-dependent helicase/nuclease subunit A